MPILNLNEEMAKVEQRLNYPEEMLGKSLAQPFTNTNSGSRKIMFGSQLDQRLPLLYSEVPFIQTGYEDQFGHYSSSFVQSDANYVIASIIQKFSFKPGHHFFMILKNEEDKIANIIERSSYKHITESYGYLFDNSTIDYRKIGDTITKGEVIQKSQSFNDYNSRMDGVNLNTVYLSCEHTMEDGIILSESGQKKLASPLLKPVSIVINDNDIPLNLYGTDEVYKCLPNIGEDVMDCILCAIRREKKDESLFSQSYHRLKTILMSDDKFTVEGKVIDIDIFCNNPENLSKSFYNSQLNMYHNESIRFNTELVAAVDAILAEGYSLSYDLQKIYFHAKQIVSGAQFISDRPFSNVVINIMILEENKILVGDKLTDRYGGKGVISKILPDELMPMLDNGQAVDIINNQNTCVNRENAGQLFEVSLNHISHRLIEFINSKVLDVGECLELLLQYFHMVSPELASYVESMTNNFTRDEDIIQYIGSISSDNGIIMSILPISESMDIDKLAAIYEAFPWATPNWMVVPIEDSNGNIRYIKSRRPIIGGHKYIYRLKQYAKEKVSATSLSSTNIKNENTRNKANRSFKSMYTRTPIRFGDMESGDLGHLGMEAVIVNLMLYSTSPHGRRLAEQLLTGDPFNIDIKLDMGATNRSVEIVEAYLKTMGLRLVFKKRYKQLIDPAVIDPVVFVVPDRSEDLIVPAYIVDNIRDICDIDTTPLYTAETKLITPALITPAIFVRPDE